VKDSKSKSSDTIKPSRWALEEKERTNDTNNLVKFCSDCDSHKACLCVLLRPTNPPISSTSEINKLELKVGKSILPLCPNSIHPSTTTLLISPHNSITLQTPTFKFLHCVCFEMSHKTILMSCAYM
jgi:hypothetical protein